MLENNQKEYPIMFSAEYPEKSSRWLGLATILMLIKPLLLIPHFIVLYVYGVISFIAFVAAQFAILFTGHYPKPLFMLVKSSLIWQNRVSGYFMGLTDKYPPFNMGLNEEESKQATKGLLWIVGVIVVMLILLIALAFGNNN